MSLPAVNTSTRPLAWKPGWPLPCLIGAQLEGHGVQANRPEPGHLCPLSLRAHGLPAAFSGHQARPCP